MRNLPSPSIPPLRLCENISYLIAKPPSRKGRTPSRVCRFLVGFCLMPRVGKLFFLWLLMDNRFLIQGVKLFHQVKREFLLALVLDIGNQAALSRGAVAFGNQVFGVSRQRGIHLS